MMFSVVTVVLDDLVGLQRTRRSVELQTFRDLEWLVLDGASRDGTVEWLESLKDPRMKWWSAPDQGLYDAMNKGIEHTSGDFLVFLNAGDEFAHERVLEQVANTVSVWPEVDFIYGDTVDITPDGVSTYYRRARSHEARWWTMFACHQAMYFRRSRVGSLRHRLEYRNAGDYQFVSEFLSSQNGRGDATIRRVEGPLCRFWLGGNSSLHREKTLLEEVDIRRRFLKVSRPLNAALFLGHRVHTWLKRRAFKLTRLLRKL